MKTINQLKEEITATELSKEVISGTAERGRHQEKAEW